MAIDAGLLILRFDGIKLKSSSVKLNEIELPTSDFKDPPTIREALLKYVAEMNKGWVWGDSASNLHIFKFNYIRIAQ